MTPDYQKAAIKAIEILERFNISTAPVDPLRILKQIPGVLVFSFQEVSENINVDRKEILNTLGCKNQDAVTTAFVDGDSLQYVVTYNRILPSVIVDRAIARELGHVVLGHDGTRPEDVRNIEAKVFAHHLLCPRPLIRSIDEAGIRLTEVLFSSITGLDSNCLPCIRNQPPVFVPAEMNRRIKEQFLPYIMNLTEYNKFASQKDRSALVDLGNYMEGYEE